MGGNVGVIIKKENGEQIGMSRWTNSMPYHFSNPLLYQGKTKEWFEEFSSEWFQMKADYEENKTTGKFKYNMTPVYFPHSSCSPDEYGIIAVDLKNKKIYSSQDYCSIGKLPFYKMWERYFDNTENIEALKGFFQSNMLHEIEYYPDKKGIPQTMDISSLKFDEIITLLQEANSTDVNQFSHPLFNGITKENFQIYRTSFLIHSDWKFVTYHDRSLGVLKIKQALDQDGFTFTDSDNLDWKKYLAHRWDGYDDSELVLNPDYQQFMVLYQEIFKEPFTKK